MLAPIGNTAYGKEQRHITLREAKSAQAWQQFICLFVSASFDISNAGPVGLPIVVNVTIHKLYRTAFGVECCIQQVIEELHLIVGAVLSELFQCRQFLSEHLRVANGHRRLYLLQSLFGKEIVACATALLCHIATHAIDELTCTIRVNILLLSKNRKFGITSLIDMSSLTEFLDGCNKFSFNLLQQFLGAFLTFMHRSVIIVYGGVVCGDIVYAVIYVVYTMIHIVRVAHVHATIDSATIHIET